MKKHTKLIRVISVVILLSFMYHTSVQGEAYNFDKAVILKKLGLIKITGNSFELEKGLTRAQGTVVVLRVLGLENAAGKSKIKSNFTDVTNKHWASKYINYAVSKGLVGGVGKKAFAPERLMSGKEFIMLMLRALGYSNFDARTFIKLSVSSKMLTLDRTLSLAAKPHFLRDDMVEVIYAALKTKHRQTGTVLITKLVNSGVVSENTLKNSRFLEENPLMDRIDKAVTEKLKKHKRTSKKPIH